MSGVADMREFDRVPRGADADPRGPADVLRERAAQAAAVRRQIGDLTGAAATEDGLLRLAVDAGGLRELDIAPRAMRMPSVDLAAAIVALSRQAREDLDRRRRELADEHGITPAGVDLDESLARLERLRGLVAEGHGDARRLYERFRDGAGG
jgi:hypothetical protein